MVGLCTPPRSTPPVLSLTYSWPPVVFYHGGPRAPVETSSLLDARQLPLRAGGNHGVSPLEGERASSSLAAGHIPHRCEISRVTPNFRWTPLCLLSWADRSSQIDLGKGCCLTHDLQQNPSLPDPLPGKAQGTSGVHGRASVGTGTWMSRQGTVRLTGRRDDHGIHAASMCYT